MFLFVLCVVTQLVFMCLLFTCPYFTRVVLHVTCYSSGLVCMWVVLRVWVLHVVRVRAVVVNRVFVRSVCGHTVGVPVFVVHVVCCSFVRASCGLFFM